jgi:hypothetical protein
MSIRTSFSEEEKEMMEQPEIINVKGGQEKPFEIEIIPIDKM